MSEAMQPKQLVPVLTDEEVAEIEHEIAHLPDRESAAIDALMIVQKHRGWVSDESLFAIAKLLDMSAAELDGIATFYNLIFRQPVGKHVVMVCDSVSCYVMGADQLAQDIKSHLGLEFGQTTEDGNFTLLPIVCLGACDKAPTMMIDEDLVENVKSSDLTEIFARYV
ncbi:MAG: NADH-quinone oxidoreductase subunit NuoE [Gammaproteobacteria bacterium]|nr:NADH-quinone oxidoreductase subunit NuoE [Gammaproteobacteria bacterium]